MAKFIYPGTATAANVLSGMTFSAGPLYNAVGTLDDYSGLVVAATVAEPTPGQLGIKAWNFSNGFVDADTVFVVDDGSYISANILAGRNMLGLVGSATNDANATAADIVAGKTAYINGNKVTGNRAGAPVMTQQFSADALPTSVTATSVYWNCTMTVPGGVGKTLQNLLINLTATGGYISCSDIPNVKIYGAASWGVNFTTTPFIIYATAANQIAVRVNNVSFNSATGVLNYRYEIIGQNLGYSGGSRTLNTRCEFV